jgi:hypothetical protein
MGSPVVTPTQDTQSRRKEAEAVEARATWFMFRSRRGLLNRMYAVNHCPTCSEAHQFHAAGLRIAPCGAHLVIKARKARSR